MSCPTCDHTMQKIGDDRAGDSIFWCPRCGTWKAGNDDLELAVVPVLVPRCREFESRVIYPRRDWPWLGGEWHTLGLGESINKPEDRK